MIDPQRLRDLADLDIDMTTEERQLCLAAADEIERLRARIAELEAAIGGAK